MARRDLSGARVLVTGASSGIGRALAVRLATAGSRLLLTGRREDRLSELASQLRSGGCHADWMAGDIADAPLRENLVAWANEHWAALDILVNNAGIGAHGLWSQSTPDTLRRVMEVNFFAPLELTRSALPLLRRGNAPLIANVSSVLGHFAIARRSEYCASKFALHGISDALRVELADEIDVLLVSPSTTSSEFFDRAISLPNEPARHRRGMPPDRVALFIERAMRAGRREIILSWGGTFLVWLDRLAPGLMSSLMRMHARRQN